MTNWIIKCDEARLMSDQNQYGELDSKKGFVLKTHLILCVRCRVYEKQNTALSKQLKNHRHAFISEEQKEKIKELLKKASPQ